MLSCIFYFLIANCLSFSTMPLKCLRLIYCATDLAVYGQKNAKKDDEKKDEEFTCPEGQGNGNFADPATCRRFYQVINYLAFYFILKINSQLKSFSVECQQCVDGYPYLNRCPSGLHFDDISKFCTFKNEARCGPIATSKYFLWKSPSTILYSIDCVNL